MPRTPRITEQEIIELYKSGRPFKEIIRIVGLSDYRTEQSAILCTSMVLKSN